MPSRRRSRERALQVMYEWDLRHISIEDALESFYEVLYSDSADEMEKAHPPSPDAFTETLAKGASAAASSIDLLIERHSQNWRLERMSLVDRNLLRLAIYEMTRLGTPPAIVIDEALELARMFSGEQSVPFVNGVLDAVRKQPAQD
jgi:N utilization substance protein B